MNVIMLHCHWERGGVTQVAENHVWALRQAGHAARIFLGAGPRQGGLSEATRRETEGFVIEDFDYDQGAMLTGSGEPRGREIAQRLSQQLRSFGCTPTTSVLHWHNHSLGKNTAAPAAVAEMAEMGWRMLLQIHDFAEDNRPENYARLVQASGAKDAAELDRYLYPVGEQIHYATLTRADSGILSGLGIPLDRIHQLPNSVVAPHGEAVSQNNEGQNKERARLLVQSCFGLPSDAKWCLYPVRGIRRKNVGEFLLLCRWLPDGVFGGLTLRPSSPIEAASYDRWKGLAKKVSPRTVFDAAHHPELDFPTNLAASEFALSSSVAEGFGMAFLEPWLMGRGVVGRRIPTTCDDFAAAGIRFHHLYDQIPIPGTRQWLNQVHQESARAMAVAWETLPEPFRPSVEWRSDAADDTIDFARLTPARQVEVLERMAADSAFASETRGRSHALVESLSRAVDLSMVDHNRRVIYKSFSSRQQGERLLSTYQPVMDSEVDGTLSSCEHAGRAVELTSQTHPFYPCRTERLPGDHAPTLA